MDARRGFALGALAIIVAHATALVFLRSSMAVSDLAICSAAALATVACYRQTRQRSSILRAKWTLFFAGLLLWSAGQAAFTYQEGIQHLQQLTALTSDFFFFLFGVPLLLAISSSNERKGTTALLVLDCFQAVLAVYLIHLQLFPHVSGSQSGGAISALRLMHAYNIENLILTAAATVRILAKPQGEEKRLYCTLCGFLWVYSLTAAALNYVNLPTGSPLDLLWDVPFLLLALLLVSVPKRPEPEAAHAHHHQVALLITSACPIFFTMALLIMGILVARAQFALGIACIVSALLTYGLRNSLLQRRYMQAEQRLLDGETALRQSNERFEELSYLDALTGIANRRKFEEMLEGEWNRALRTGSPLSLLMIDLDHFKLLNDRFGHLHGDNCLIAVARALAGNLRRSGELLARFGGEEFVAILPNVDRESAVSMAEEMREAVVRLGFANGASSAHAAMTVSMGVATGVPEIGSLPADLLRVADEALYRAKCDGRNCVAHGTLSEGELARVLHSFERPAFTPQNFSPQDADVELA